MKFNQTPLYNKQIQSLQNIPNYHPILNRQNRNFNKSSYSYLKPIPKPYVLPTARMSLGNLALLGASIPSGAVGGWKELGRISSASPIDVTGLANKRYYMILNHLINSGQTVPKLRTGNTTFDTGTNYAERRSNDGATDGTAINADRISWSGVQLENNETLFGVGYWGNLSAKEKLLIWHTNQSEALGAGTPPSRREGVAKWVNTVNPIDRFQVIEEGAGAFTTDSELVILGWDPADIHTDNFWEELEETILSGTTTDSATFTAKKYLWIQIYIKPTGGTFQNFIQFNLDTANNYSVRRSFNGGGDSTFVNINSIGAVEPSVDAFGRLINIFIINRLANEKLLITHVVQGVAAGAGTAPQRSELVHKWANTVAQITKVTVALNSGTGTMGTGSIMKIWGAN